MIETIVSSALGIVVAAAPGVLAALTGKQDDKAAIEAARDLVRALPEREAKAGDDTAGAWDEDLAKRKRRGEESTVSIVVNGRTVEAPRVLFYGRAVQLAGMSGLPTVTFRKTKTGDGVLSPGRSVEVQSGTVVDITHMSGA